MLISRFVASIFTVGTMVLGVESVCGQAYPNKPIRLVTAEIGGSNDLASRILAQGLSSSLGQQVIIDNRGGNSSIPAMIVVQAPPDGYTLLVYGNSIWTGTLLQKRAYDPQKDLTPISLTNRQTNILVAHPSFPAKSIKELIALAKARPGEFNYASGLTGSSSHLAGELFKAMAGVNLVRVPYKGNGPAVIGLLGGEAQVFFATPAAVAPHLKSGKVRILAVTGLKPSELLPGVPTIADSGLPGYELEGVTGVFAPAKTPAPIIDRLNQEIVRFLKTAETKAKFLSAGTEVVGSTPAELAAAVKSEIIKMGKVIKDAGITEE